MTEAQLCEANGLVARFYKSRNPDEKLVLQDRLQGLGVELDNPVPWPDPRAPAGGSAVAVRRVA